MSFSGGPWKFSFEIPTVENVHAIVHTFLRTSEFGSWSPHAEECSDEFVLNYQRGVWTPPPSKLRFYLTIGMGTYEQYLRNSGWDGWKTVPLELRVAFRPVPSTGQVKVLLEYQFVGPNPDVVLKVWGKQLLDQLSQETASLVSYVRDNFELPSLPTIVNH